MDETRILVCVTRQKTCERLIQEGVRLCERQPGGVVSVVHVADSRSNFLGVPQEAEAIEYLYQVAKAANAEMTILRASSILDTLVDFAREQQVHIIVTGISPGKSGADFAQSIRLRLPGVQVHSVMAKE